MKNNILYIIDLFDDLGGAEKNLLQIMTNLNPEKYQPFLCCIKGGKLEKEMEKKGFQTINLNIRKIYSPSAIYKIIKLAKYIKTNHIKLIVTYHFSSDFIGWLLAKLLNTPVISSKRDMGYNLNPRHRLIYRIIGRFYDLILTVSNAVRNEFVKIHHSNKENFKTIYNGIEIEKYNLSVLKKDKKKELGLKEDIPVVGIIAGVRKIKGLKYFIEAASIVKKSSINSQFVIIGADHGEPGSSQEDLTELAEKLGVMDSIYFLGGRNDIPECLCAMDIFVLSSLSEGFSNAILEAMAAKIPVIATNVGGNSESVISGETGLLVPPADSNSLGNAIVTLLKNKKLARQMGESGLEMAEAKFQLKRMISENEETYDYVLRKKRRSIEGSADKLSDYRWLFHQGAKVAVASIFYYSGIIKIYVKIKRILGYSTIKILTYHNISDDYPDFLGICHTVDSFKKQINFLKDNYNIKTLEDSITCLKEPKHYEDITVITFDDAYKEFIDVVIPILGRDNLPATFFLSVDPIQSGIPLTIDLIICAMAITSKKEMDFRKYGLKKYFFDSNNKKEKVILSINKHFKRITSEERNEIVEDIFKILKVEKNEIEKLHKVLDWDDVRNMRRDGISIGSHTLGHPNLASIPLSDADNEIKRSKSILEEKTGLQIDYFSYPYGGYDNFNRQVSELVKESNYQGAVTLVPDSGKELDEFLIPRLSISKGMCMGPFNNFSESLMAAEICGISKYIFLRFLKSDDMDA